jgi:hypothetical protein
MNEDVIKALIRMEEGSPKRIEASL